MKKEVQRGQVMPWGYGVSHWDFYRDLAICYPFPLNHIIGFSRKVWRKIRDEKLIEEHVKISRRITDVAWREEAVKRKETDINIITEYLRGSVGIREEVEKIIEKNKS